MKQGHCLAAVALLLVAQSSALAVDTTALRTELSDLEQQANALQIRFNSEPVDAQQTAAYRLVDAQVLYNLKDYSRAAIVLFDYINKYPNTRGYQEALFFLADSLYQRRDYLSARRYYLKIINEVRGAYYQDALQRLVELALRTHDVDTVKPYLAALEQIPPSQRKPSVPYVVGKFHFFTNDTERAIAAFSSIQQNQQYFLQAQYFMGTCYVRNKDYARALNMFQSLLRLPAGTDAEKHVQELTYLAIGRLLYEQNKIAEAIDAYQRVSRRSSAFDTALYEIAWAYVKAGAFDKALRALDLLVLAQPDSPFVPDVTVLQGNLLIRLEQWGRATELFTGTRDRFLPVHGRMKTLLTEHADPNAFFDALLGRNTSAQAMAIAAEVPKVALQWIKEKPNVKRSLTLVGDVRGIHESIKEAHRLVARLRAAIGSPSRIKIFGNLASARTSAVEVENRLARLRANILRAEYDVVEPYLTTEERQEFITLADERRSLDSRLDALPEDAMSFNRRSERQLKRLTQLERQISRLQVMVSDLVSQMVAVERYFSQSDAAKDKAKRDSFNKETQLLRMTTAALEQEIEQVGADLDNARYTVGLGSPEETAERQIKERYRVLSDNEHKFVERFADRISNPENRALFSELGRLMARCESVDTTLRLFNGKLEKNVDERLAHVRLALNEEEQALSGFEHQNTGFRAETNRVAGALTHNGFRDIARRFYDIVVRADVGIIDVAWALKDSKTKEVSGLVQQQKMDLKLLDTEFKEVLEKK